MNRSHPMQSPEAPCPRRDAICPRPTLAYVTIVRFVMSSQRFANAALRTVDSRHPRDVCGVQHLRKERHMRSLKK